MRTIIQVSDLHFGMILQPTLEPLLDSMWAIAPDLVIVSGDVTQRARVDEFRAARAYIERMPGPRLVIPGNHDVPLYNVVRRFAQPLARFQEYIGADLAPVYVDDEVAVVGINSARSFTFKGGTLSEEQVAEAVRHFDSLTHDQVKIVVAHHPFDIPVGLTGVRVVKGVGMAMQRFSTCHVDMFLAGHLHLVHLANARMYVPGFDATILQAGTATSSRARGEPNSFFVFLIGDGNVAVEIHRWNAADNTFAATETRHLTRSDSRPSASRAW